MRARLETLPGTRRLILCGAIVLLLLSAPAVTRAACTCGDLDGSGVVDAADVAALALAAGGTAPPSLCCGEGVLACGDLDGSGDVTLTDVGLLGDCIGMGGLCSCAGPTCGNGVVEGAEACDAGSANGTPTSCCDASCTLRPSTDVCRPAADACDLPEGCTGLHADCPVDGVAASGVECRAAAAPCDIPETCSGVEAACPADSYVAPPGAKCKPAVVLTPGAPGDVSDALAGVLDGSAGTVQTYLSGTFSLPRGSARLFDYAGAPAKVALLLTNDAGSAPVDVVWRGKLYQAAPGQQIVAIVPAAKKAKLKLKSKQPATGTIEVATLPESPLVWSITATPRPILYNQRKGNAKVTFTLTDLGGLSALQVYQCTSPSYGANVCSPFELLGAGFAGESVGAILPSGSALFVGVVALTPGGPVDDGDVTIQFSEKTPISYAIRADFTIPGE